MTLSKPAYALFVPVLLAGAAQAGTVNVGVDVTQTWLSYADVFELPAVPGADRGAFVYGQFYYSGFYAVPPGTVAGNLVQLRPNTTLATADTDTANPFFSFWWTSDGVGGYAPNKIVQDGFYIQDDTLAGNDIAFSGFVVANTLSAPYGASARAYVVDTFGPGYDFIAVQYTPLVAGQAFSVNLTVPAGHHAAYGIEVVGPNAHASALNSLGAVQVTAIPEPSRAALVLAGLLALGIRLQRRRR